MTLVIDASNILAGGGLIHLIEVLRHARPEAVGFEKVIVCARENTLVKIESRSWLMKVSHPWLKGGYISRWRWRKNILPQVVKSEKAFLFCPGVNRPAFKWPYVTMCQNLLPLEVNEITRYGFSLVGLRLWALRISNILTYERAVGVIFLTQYCQNILPERSRRSITNYIIIPHGINHELFHRDANVGISHEKHSPFKLLYVSRIDIYKNQDNIAKAIIDLNKAGYPIELTLIGLPYMPSLKKLNKILLNGGQDGKRINHRLEIPYSEIASEYEKHDAFIFGSSCETFGMILTEAMAMGMPIACSSRSSLPETMGDAGIYFDPFEINSICNAVLQLYRDGKLRKELSERAIRRAKEYNWVKCADDTFTFLSKTSKTHSF